MTSLYHAINWQALWYRTLTIPPCHTNFHHVKDWLNTANTSTIYNYRNQPINFVAQDDLPPNTAYETFIAQTGHIPTRDNFHDLLGGVIWLNYPKAKAVFNQLHQQDIEKNGVQHQRSLIRNILTLFDENGGVVVSRDKRLLQELQQFNWQSALFDKKSQWLDGHTQFFPIGHALLEKLITPRNNITAHVILLDVSDGFFNQTIEQQRDTLDKFLCHFSLNLAQKADLTSKMFQPLPVMGIGGFSHHQTLAFYQDKTIFREPRNAPPSGIYRLNL